MKHLVLGSEGQVGQYVCKNAEENGDEVIRYDVSLGSEFDLRNSDHNGHLLERMLESDFVHFLAYDVGGSRYLADKQAEYDYLDGNMALMRNVFACLKATGKPFYFASSQMQNMTDSPYGILKNIGEKYTTSLSGVNVRFWNVFGYEQDEQKAHVITDFIKSAHETGQILCRTNGEEKRSFIYGADAANDLSLIPHNYRRFLAFGEPVHVYDRMLTIRQVADAIARIVGNVDVYYTDKFDKTQTIHNVPRTEHMAPFISGLMDNAAATPARVDFIDAIKEIYAKMYPDA